jgi:hypothetical protein
VVPVPLRQPEDVAEANPEPSLDGCFAPDGTDLTLIAEMLAMSPSERLDAAQSFASFVAAARPLDDDRVSGPA